MNLGALRFRSGWVCPAALLTAQLIAGCVGTVGDNGNGGSSPGGSSVGNPPGGGGGPGGSGDPVNNPPPPPPPTVAAPGTCGAPVVSTLLTFDQYSNTVTDLLGMDARAKVAFKDANGRKYRPDLRVSALEAEELMGTARDIADLSVTAANMSKLLPCDPAAVTETKCADQFIDRFGARVMRRPLTDDARSDLRALYDAGQKEGGFTTGIKWVVEGLLQSPEFLYHLVAPADSAKPGDVVGLNDFEIADRLSYFLWNSGPDETLWQAAAKGQLHTADQLTAQVTRMRSDARSSRAREDFYRNWLSLDLVGSLTRDDPAYTPALAQALGKSAMAGIHDVYQTDGKSDSLFGSSSMFVDSALAKLYGAPAAALTGAGTDLKSVAFDKTQRRGILTHPATMAIIAEHDTSDPIHRGTFVYTKVLCQNIPPPADAVPALPTLAPNLTTRQRLVEHRSAPACSGCHSLFDPIGLAFENFDQLGRFRAEEHGSKIDSSGAISQGDLDISGTFADGFTLFDRLSQSKSVRSCMAQMWYEYASRRDVDTSDKCGFDPIKARFMASGDLNDLLASIASSDVFRNRLVTQE
jgi:hypothetical protein